MRWLLAAALLLGLGQRSALAGCDLGQVVGYQLVAAKVIEAYIQDGKRVPGFSGCNRERVLVFTDGTGVRCKDVDSASGHLPTAYLFARSENDMKLCVGDALYEVARPN
jgi:hypothetical protein